MKKWGSWVHTKSEGCFDTSKTMPMACGWLKLDGVSWVERGGGLRVNRGGRDSVSVYVFIKHLLNDLSFTLPTYLPIPNHPIAKLNPQSYIVHPRSPTIRPPSVSVLSRPSLDGFEIIPITIESTYSLRPVNRTAVGKQANPVVMMSSGWLPWWPLVMEIRSRDARGRFAGHQQHHTSTTSNTTITTTTTNTISRSTTVK